MYEHKTQTIENKTPLMIRVGSKQDAEKQLGDIYHAAGLSADKQTFLKLCPNIKKLELQNADKLSEVQSNIPKQPESSSGGGVPKAFHVEATPGFSIKDIKL
ncbi:hypothetical protein KKG31_00690 [Patescibacteria group bacterium]|nr:hypothetical protein [Patescibacteria group bacterium]MBU1757702.1 hypothetical protein [Patescibacteria group bacterium]